MALYSLKNRLFMSNYLIINNLDFYKFNENFNDFILSQEKLYDDYMVINSLLDEAPYLINVKSGVNFHDFLSNTTSIFFESEQDLIKLRGQLSENLSITTDKNENLHFRFYDSRVIELLKNIINLEQFNSIFKDIKFIEYFDYLSLGFNKISFKCYENKQKIIFTSELMSKINEKMVDIHLMNFIKYNKLNSDLDVYEKLDFIHHNYNILIESGFDDVNQVFDIMSFIFFKDLKINDFSYLLNAEISSDFRYIKLKRDFKNASI
ncbi:DUF4123 domain-containing protein [Acinetobacter sp. RF14B]|nr:DUF4123 domain-containing protein [Acinetobacter sp. RF14B]